MNKTSILAWLIVLFSTVSLFAQNEGEVFTVRALVCDSLGTAVKDVAVYDLKNDLRSITDQDGVARIAARLGETLCFSHLSFKTEDVCIKKELLVADGEGHYSMLVVMRRKTNTLQEVTVTENAPHLAYANKMVWVIDYKVQPDGIYMVMGNSEESVLLHLNFEQDTISRRPISSKYQELYRDAFNNLHLIGSDSTYQIYCDGEHLHLLYGCMKDAFRRKLKPVVAATDSIIVVEERRSYGQEVAFVAINRNNKRRFLLQYVGGETVEMARNWALDNYRDAVIDAAGSEFAIHSYDINIHEEADGEINNMKDDMMKRLMLRSVYCPVFGIGNKLYLFAFPEDALIVFDQNGQQERSMEVNFHKNLGTGLSQHLTSNNPWDKNLIFDPVRMMMYAQYKTNGIVTLREIDLRDGKTKREIQLTDHIFPQNIQVYDGNVYYLYCDKTRMVDKRSLYKMMLK